MSNLLDLTPVVQWQPGGLAQWSIARAPVMFIDEPVRFLTLEQEDPATDGDVIIGWANSLQQATLDRPIKRLNLRAGDAVALVGVKHRPVIIASSMPGSRSRLCIPVYSYKPKSGPKEDAVARLMDPSLFPVPALPPVLDDSGYARLDRMTVVPEGLLTPTTFEVEPEAAKLLEALVFAQFSGRVPKYIADLRDEFAPA